MLFRSVIGTLFTAVTFHELFKEAALNGNGKLNFGVEWQQVLGELGASMDAVGQDGTVDEGVSLPTPPADPFVPPWGGHEPPPVPAAAQRAAHDPEAAAEGVPMPGKHESPHLKRPSTGVFRFGKGKGIGVNRSKPAYGALVPAAQAMP